MCMPCPESRRPYQPVVLRPQVGADFGAGQGRRGYAAPAILHPVRYQLGSLFTNEGDPICPHRRALQVVSCRFLQCRLQSLAARSTDLLCEGSHTADGPATRHDAVLTAALNYLRQ